MSDTNEKGIRAWAKNGGKRDMKVGGAATALTLGTLLATIHLTPSLMPYVTAEEFKDTTSTVVEVKTEVKNFRRELTEFKEEYREETRETQTLLRQVLVSQGLIPAGKPKTDTVFVVDSTHADSTNPR